MLNLPSVYLIYGSDAPQHSTKMKEILLELVKENRIKAFKTLESKTEWLLPSEEFVERDLIIVLLTDQIAEYHVAGTRGLKELQAKNKQLKVMEIIVDSVPYDDSFIIAPITTEPIRKSPQIDEIWAGIKKDLFVMFPAPEPEIEPRPGDYKKYVKYIVAAVVLGLTIFGIAKLVNSKPEVSFGYDVRDLTMTEKKDTTECYQPCIAYFFSESKDIDSLSWDFGDTLMKAPSKKLRPEHTFNQAGTYTIKLTATKGTERGIVEKNLTVKPVPYADFDVSYSNNSMAPSDVSFINNSTNATRYVWRFPNGDTLTTKNPMNKHFATSGVFDVILDAFNADGIKGSVKKQVTILQEEIPVARFSARNLGVVNGKYVVEFTNQSVFSDSYIWDFGDNSPKSLSKDPVVTHPYDQSQDYTIILEASKNGAQISKEGKVVHTGILRRWDRVYSERLREVVNQNSTNFSTELRQSSVRQRLQIVNQ